MNKKARKEKHTHDIFKSAGIFILMVLIIPILVFLLAMLVSCFASAFLNSSVEFKEQAGVIAGMIGGVIAAIAAGLVLYQLDGNRKERIRQNKIEEASFILQLNQSYVRDPNIPKVESLLEGQTFYHKPGPMITDKTRQKFVNYLAYFDALAPLITKEVLTLDYIDDLMAYRFYLAVNNKEVQDEELLKFPGDYRGCFKLYKLWTEYRKNNNKKILGEENALNKWIYFNEYANEPLLESITPRQLDEEFPLSEEQAIDIADLIFETDPYIYPILFSEKMIPEKKFSKNARLIIPEVLADGKDAMFNKRNLFVCTHEQEIIALILWISGSLNWNSDSFCQIAKKAGVELDNNDVQYLNNECFNVYGNSTDSEEIISITNVCVKPEYRKKGVGKFMMDQFISAHHNTKMELTVLEDNSSAIKLYKNENFKVLKNRAYTSEVFSSEKLNNKLFSDIKPRCLVMSRN